MTDREQRIVSVSAAAKLAKTPDAKWGQSYCKRVLSSTPYEYHERLKRVRRANMAFGRLIHTDRYGRWVR